MRKLVVLTLLFAATGLNLNKPSEAAGPLPKDAPATSTIADTDPVTGTAFRIGSDSLGPYRNGVDSVSSIIQGIGDWELDGKASPLRKVRIDFGDPVPNSGANPPFPAATIPTRFISKCASWNLFMPGFAIGQPMSCPLAISSFTTV